MNDSKNNIRFNYLYRDGGNYKVWGSEVFSNPDLLLFDCIDEGIRKSLIDGEFFDLKYWKVKRLKHDDWVPELDHTWNEFESIEMSVEEPTVDSSITEFLDKIAQAPK
jgi:hypothetical protein